VCGCRGTVLSCEEPGRLGSGTASDGADLGGALRRESRTAVQVAADRTAAKIYVL